MNVIRTAPAVDLVITRPGTECPKRSMRPEQNSTLDIQLAAAAAAAAKSFQSYPTLCDPIDGSPPGSPVPRILQASMYLGRHKSQNY